MFEIYVKDTITEHNIFSKYIDNESAISNKKWHDFDVPLDEFTGKNITISFEVSSGPNNDNSYDRAFWGEPRIIVRK